VNNFYRDSIYPGIREGASRARRRDPAICWGSRPGSGGRARRRGPGVTGRLPPDRLESSEERATSRGVLESELPACACDPFGQARPADRIDRVEHVPASRIARSALDKRAKPTINLSRSLLILTYTCYCSLTLAVLTPCEISSGPGATRISSTCAKR